jgi:hypothetical protein
MVFEKVVGGKKYSAETKRELNAAIRKDMPQEQKSSERKPTIWAAPQDSLLFNKMDNCDVWENIDADTRKRRSVVGFIVEAGNDFKKTFLTIEHLKAAKVLVEAGKFDAKYPDLKYRGVVVPCPEQGERFVGENVVKQAVVLGYV